MKDKTELRGLGGWLVLIAVGVTIAPFLNVVTDFNTFYTSFDAEAWSALTNSNSAAYNPYFASYFSLGVIISVIIDAYLFYLMYLFYKESSSFPSLYIKLIFAVFIFIILDLVVASLIFPSLTTSDLLDLPTIKGIFQSIFAILVWVPYMMKSVRVKNTFVN